MIISIGLWLVALPLLVVGGVRLFAVAKTNDDASAAALVLIAAALFIVAARIG